jgi:hypothetical protein
MKSKFVAVVVIGIAAVFSMANSNCAGNNTDTQQRIETERMVLEASRQTGMPNIRNFTERKFAKMIYELRDKEVITYSYFMDMHGGLHFLCESIGFGLPYSVQYVNPEKWGSYHGDGTIPQPEPNGLFMPDSLSATWVLCSDGKGNVKPVYSEPPLIVSPFRLSSQDDLRRRMRVQRVEK